jgi:hypothetical protein
MRRSVRSALWVWLVWAVTGGFWVVVLARGLVSPGFVLARLALGVGVLFALIVTHELGHALVGRLLGYRVFELSFGTGKPRVDVVLGRTQLLFGPLPAGGHTLLAPKGARLVPAREVFVSLAGPAVNLFTLAWALGTDLPAELRSVVVFMSAALVVGNLLPRRAVGPLGNATSDGLRAAHALDADDDGVSTVLASRYLGESYISHAKGDHAEAMTWDERGLASYPGNAALEGDVATTMVLLGDFRPAREGLIALLERDDLKPIQRALYQNNLAWADLMTSDPELLLEANTMSKESFATLPTLPAVRGTRGFALILNGAIDEGIALCSDAFRTNRDGDNRASNACAMSIGASRQGRIAAAERLLERAIRSSPDNRLIDRAGAELRAARQAVPVS